MNNKSNGFKERSKKIMTGTKNFFKKEGLYVALFVGLCVVTIIGAIAIKGVGNNPEGSKENKENEVALNIEENQKTNVESVMENSERVEGEKQQTSTKPVGNNSKMDFNKPLEGKLLKSHNEPYIFKDGKQVREGEKGDSSYSYGGISIKAPLGTAVKAAEDGIIESIIENDVTYGVTVTIKHPNGIKTSYSNLDKNLKLKKDDKVTKGQEIGKIGNTSSTLKMCIKEDFLHLKVFSKKDNKYTEVDPIKYFNYKK